MAPTALAGIALWYLAVLNKFMSDMMVRNKTWLEVWDLHFEK